MMLKIYKEDVRRYFTRKELSEGVSSWKMWKKIFRENTLWIIFLHRIGRWLYNDFKIPIVRFIFALIYEVVRRPIFLIHGTNINLKADIGRGFYLGHYGGIWIGPVKIGENCNLSQGVTIGIGGKGENRGFPEIGNNVFIGPGAVLFGKIRIGNGVAIGANSVVSKSIPDNSVVVGNPSRIVGNEGSGDFIEIIDDDSIL